MAVAPSDWTIRSLRDLIVDAINRDGDAKLRAGGQKVHAHALGDRTVQVRLHKPVSSRPAYITITVRAEDT